MYADLSRSLTADAPRLFATAALPIHFLPRMATFVTALLGGETTMILK
jgi:hypothetical protein